MGRRVALMRARAPRAELRGFPGGRLLTAGRRHGGDTSVGATLYARLNGAKTDSTCSSGHYWDTFATNH
jgi:hypothetical protein